MNELEDLKEYEQYLKDTLKETSQMNEFLLQELTIIKEKIKELEK